MKDDNTLYVSKPNGESTDSRYSVTQATLANNLNSLQNTEIDSTEHKSKSSKNRMSIQAKFALLSPVAVFGATFISAHLNPTYLPWAYKVVQILLFTGIITGIIACTKSKTWGYKKNLIPGIIGIVLSLGHVSIAVLRLFGIT